MLDFCGSTEVLPTNCFESWSLMGKPKFKSNYWSSIRSCSFRVLENTFPVHIGSVMLLMQNVRKLNTASRLMKNLKRYRWMLRPCCLLHMKQDPILDQDIDFSLELLIKLHESKRFLSEDIWDLYVVLDLFTLDNNILPNLPILWEILSLF